MVCPAWWYDANVHVCLSSVVLMLALVLKHMSVHARPPIDYKTLAVSNARV